ncbi:hypothetical protein KIL84_002550 [Mauremys mutica]|uniref:Uncharacterized protein n=1 Tax=Mauremys mutica TaxID=74926 RepID=A0A9D4AZC8_9SAUR|nr:hypothetical protein KIL84_002550 [Mauremys mutica]
MLTQKEKSSHQNPFLSKPETCSRYLTDAIELPVGINEHLMTLQLKLSNNLYATVISASAPTLDEEDNQEQFYIVLS